jgi:hypothetical protein
MVGAVAAERLEDAVTVEISGDTQWSLTARV